ncbi:hypothetical protein PSPO01_16398, partial [Paraphaeosphaeria sporulosa]
LARQPAPSNDSFVSICIANGTFSPTRSRPSLYFSSTCEAMNCANEWLSDVCAFGGDSEPPPTPTIPADYVQKPRRQPLPDAYLVSSPPPFKHASLAPLKRRRAALSDLDPPNQKRLRPLKAPARAMSQSSGSPTRRSNRQPGTARKALISTTEAPALENMVATAKHTLFPKQDFKATPRPTRLKRAAPPSLPAPNLHTRPAPVLTPSVSDTHVDEDSGDIEPGSTYGSTTSVVDLRIASKPVVSKSATSSVDIPHDNGRLRPTQNRSCSGMHESAPPSSTINFSHLITIRSQLFLNLMPSTLQLPPFDVYA